MNILKQTFRWIFWILGIIYISAPITIYAYYRATSEEGITLSMIFSSKTKKEYKNASIKVFVLAILFSILNIAAFTFTFNLLDIKW